MILPGRLAPAEMFPAGRRDLRTSSLALPSGLNVRAVEAGDKLAPLVLLFPGWACSAYVFSENLAAIANAGFRVISVDLKGHGLSDKPTNDLEYTLQSMLTHVSEIAHAIGSDRFVVGGLSMGAALAGHLAAAEPELVRGVILVSPVGFKGVPRLAIYKRATPPRAIPTLPRLATRAATKILMKRIAGRLRRFTERDVDEYWAPTQFPEFIIALRHLLHRFDWNTGLPNFEAPSIVITGTRDPFLTRRARAELSAHRPEMRHLEIKDAGHVVLDEAPDRVNAALVGFLRDLEQ